MACNDRRFSESGIASALPSVPDYDDPSDYTLRFSKLHRTAPDESVITL
jgi:hypothetical protein